MLGPWAGAVIAAAGGVALFATYWDDAWHTDVGRDSALIPPHLTLYGAVAVSGLVVAGWGLVALIRTRSLTALRSQPALVLAGLGGGLTLAAAPLDAWWHAAFGRDAVLWSPPHMLVVFASTTMVIGVLAGLRPTRHAVVKTAVAGLLLGSLAMAVMEYESDVPQFSETLYLPVLLAAGLFAVVLTRCLVPRSGAITAMVAWYIALRLAAILVLPALGRSTPDLPIAVLGLAAADLPWRRPILRYAAAAATMSALAWAAAALGLSSQSASAVGLVAGPVIVTFAVLALLLARRTGVTGVTTVAVAVTVLSALLTLGGLGGPPAAHAHDPGQGELVATTRLSVASDGHRNVQLTVVPNTCDDLEPRRIVARRAGQTLAGPLATDGGCRYSGRLHLPDGGRWFVYAELTRHNQPLEAWLPADTDHPTATSQTRELYRPHGTETATRAQIAAGAAIYLAGALLLGLALLLARDISKPS